MLRALLLVLLLPGMGYSAPTTTTLTSVRLQLKWRHQFQFAGYYAALEQGYYRAAGLDVTLLEGAQEVDPVRQVVAGQAEFGIGNSELVVRRSAGEPVVVLAAIFQHSPYVLLAARRAGIESIHDLAGKRVAMEAQTAELQAYLRNEGLTTQSIVRQPHSFGIEPLLRGEVDALSAYSTDEPFQLQAAGFDYLTFNPRAGGIDFYGDTLFTSEVQVHEHPERVRAFIAASLKGWQYALAHPEELVDLIERRYSQRHTRAHLLYEAEATRRLIMPDIVEVGYVNPGRWRFIAETYAELGLMPRDFSLAGFLYQDHSGQHLSRLYPVMGVLVLLLILTALVGLRYYNLHYALRLHIQERNRAELGLRQAEERYRTLVEQAPFPIAISSLDRGEIFYFNTRAAETFRVAAADVIGQTSAPFYTNREDRAVLLAKLGELGKVVDYEIQMRRADGEPFWAYMSVARIAFDGREAMFSAFNDITVRKKTEAERDELIAELQTALREIKILTGLIPICCSCKRIRDDEGYWQQVERYLTRHTGAQFSHGICPECFKKKYPTYDYPTEGSQSLL